MKVRTGEIVAYLLVLTGIPSPAPASEFPPETNLFDSGKGGYKRYRIPVLLTAPDKSVLAFCEGRKDGGGLTGNIDLILRRSSDNGKTWESIELVMDDGENTLGNPCPVIDRSTGVIWLAYTRSLGSDLESEIVKGKSRERTRILITHSSDSGKSWAKPMDWSDQLKRKDWAWYGTGPGIGIQMRAGRLVIPSYHTILPSDKYPNGDYQSHLIFSDDHGKTWQLGETVGPNSSECQVAERLDGSLYLNARTVFGANLRTVADSVDGGKSWSKTKLASRLYDPPCQASLLQLPSKGRPFWLFSHPAGGGRANLTIRVSRNEGKSWSFGRQISSGDNQYSGMTLMPNGEIGYLFESWREGNYQILFTSFTQEWLLRKEPPKKPMKSLPKVTVKEIRKIEGKGKDHNAFTDLCKFRNRYFLAFRKCPIGHAIYDSSKIVIMASDDGRDWKQVHSFSVKDRDVRDPHFLVFRNKLFVYSGTWDTKPIVKHRFEVNDHLGFACWTDDGSKWHGPKMLEGTHGHYVWRVVTDGRQAYLCGRRKHHFARTDNRPERNRLMESVLLASDDGLTWKFRGIIQPSYGDETAFALEDDGSILGISRSGGGRPAQVVRAKPPYTDFHRIDLDRPIGGPLLMRWGGHYLVGGRNTLGPASKCALYWLDDNRLHKIVELPSGGDTSYPGFVQLGGNRALLSYYSSHEGYPTLPGREPPSSIFIAELELETE